MPANAERIMAMGGAVLITNAMRRFPTVIPLQRQACLAVSREVQ